MITLYSEHAKEGDLRRLSHLECPVNLIVASDSLDNFRRIRDEIGKVEAVKQVGYWPTLSAAEGYWISPWSDKTALERVFREIETRKDRGQLQVMVDLEPPFVANKKRMITGLRGFSDKKKRIGEFFAGSPEKNVEIVTAEYPRFVGSDFVQKALGLSFDAGKHPNKSVKMVYTSVMPQWGIPRKIAKKLLARESRKQARDNPSFGIGLGCISHSGLLGTTMEKILTPAQLEEDLRTVREAGVREVYIYSLNGLNPDYARTIRKFSE